jgi:glucose/arabinose dehydrogenase
MSKRSINITAAVVGGIALTLFVLHVSSPDARLLFKAVRSGFIFHPRAYSAAIFPSRYDGAALDLIELPPGFEIEIYAPDVKGARSLTRSDKGTVFVGTSSEGKVYAVVDSNSDYKVDRVLTIAQGLNTPNGVAVRDGDLYVAEISRILRYDDIDEHLDNPPSPVVVYDALPHTSFHGWKFIAFGPDGKLYIPIGAPCNVCDPGDPYASITRVNPDGSDFEIFARGVRNSVGFAWDPLTGDLWFTDNGRDWMGNDKPPDELNKAPKPGLNFGFPFCYDNNIPDPSYPDHDCSGCVPPAMELDAHVAPLGMRFYMGTMFPEEYHHNIFIAEHGSWNRTAPIGYRLVRVTVAGGRATGREVFARGWLQKDDAWGRPVDILVLPDGSLLVSDDKAGAVYRIIYRAGREG